MNTTFYKLSGVVPISTDSPSFATPVFTNDQREYFIQSSSNEILIDEFLALPDKVRTQENFIQLRANPSYVVGGAFLIGFVDAERRVGVYERIDLKKKLTSEFESYCDFPFVLFAIANFLKVEWLMMQAMSSPEVASALKKGELQRPHFLRSDETNSRQKLTWSEERVRKLRELWISGLNATQIAAELGISRNAVIGKVHRLGLSDRSNPALIEAFEALAVADDGPPPRKLSLLELNQHENVCHWPVGDPGSPEFFFCGLPSITGLPYCARHSRFAYGTKEIRPPNTKTK